MSATDFLLTHWHWFSFAAVLCIADILLGTNLFLLLCGTVAILVGVVVIIFPTISWQMQLIIFSLLCVVSFIFWKLKLSGSSKTEYKINTRNSYYVGRVFILAEAILNGRGKIKVDDSHWIVAGEDTPVGEKVKVVGVDGVILKVEPFKG